MRVINRVAFYFFIGFLVFGIGKLVYAGPMEPIIGDDFQKESPESEARKKLERLQKDIQKNIEKTERLKLEERQQEAILKDIQSKPHQTEKPL